MRLKKAMQAPKSRLPPPRILVIPAILLIVGFWAWAFSPWAPSGHPDELVYKDFSLKAQAYCDEIFPDGEWKTGRENFDRIQNSKNPPERAVYAEAADETMAELVSGLQNLVQAHYSEDANEKDPEELAEDEELVRQWLGDWASYLQDRRSWTQQLKEGEDTPLRISSRDGAQADERITFFAELNGMQSCVVPSFT